MERLNAIEKAMLVSPDQQISLTDPDSRSMATIVPPRLRIPGWKGLGDDSEEKHEPASDIDTEVVDCPKALDPKRPINEADIMGSPCDVAEVPPAIARWLDV